MTRRIFLAGATGAVGKRLVPLLVGAGFEVTGTTRSAAKAELLTALGVTPVIVDVFDAEALKRAVAAAKPEIVIHQLTDLPPALDPARMAAALLANARIRTEGTRNLVEAALAAGAKRFIAQSIAWLSAPGALPHTEEDPLIREGETVRGVAVLEDLTLHSPPLAGVVLRYGQLYGPGTGFDRSSGAMPVHVDAAAHAALLAVERGGTGIFNIAEPNREISTAKAERRLGWRADFRLPGAG